MALHLLTHPYLETLALDLAQYLLTQPLQNPLASEYILVPHSGFKPWLKQFLAAETGIAANLELIFVRQAIWQLAHPLMPGLTWHSDLEEENLIWLLFETLPQLAQNPDLTELAAYLQAQPDPAQRWQLAAALAQAYTDFSVYRPEQLLAWEAGLTPHWQARLWQLLLTQTDTLRTEHRARLRARLLDLLNQEPAKLKWLDQRPERLLVFGLYSLPPMYLELLQALARHLPVKVWQTEAAATDALRQAFNQQLLKQTEVAEALPRLRSGDSLLQQLQQSLRQAKPPRMALKADHSLQVHACHSPLREVEVLCDQLQFCLETWPDLQYSDIAVMVPDISTYAPLIESVLSDAGLPFQIAQHMLGESPVFLALEALLSLAQGRLSLKEVLQVLEQPPVSASFELSTEDLQQLRDWLDAVEIRWGRDALHRHQLDLPAFEAHSWQRGLERLLLGLALPDGEPPEAFAGILPYGQIEGSLSEILNRFLNFFTQLEIILEQLEKPHHLLDWQQILLKIADTFLAGRLPAHTESVQPLYQILTQLPDAPLSPDLLVPLKVIQSWLQHSWQAPNAQQLFSGSITFAPPSLLHGLPFAVLAVLGLNIGVLPSPEPGHDLQLLPATEQTLHDEPQRLQDRSFWQDTLLSARQALLLFYQGRRVRDNQPVPPTLLLSELCDSLTTLCPEFAVTVHALHPFDPRYFNGDLPPSYAPFQAQLAWAWQQGAEDPLPPFDATPLPDPIEPVQELKRWQLMRFFENPSAFFLQQGLGLNYPKDRPEAEEDERFVLNQLEQYQLKTEALEQMLQAPSEAHPRVWQALKQTHYLADSLPIGAVAEAQLRQLQAEIRPWVQPLQAWLGPLKPATAPPQALHVANWTLHWEWPTAYQRGFVILRPATLRSRSYLTAWLEHLVLQLLAPDSPFYWLGFVKEKKQKVPYVLSFQPHPNPETMLLNYLMLFSEGLCQPLYFAPETSWALWKHREDTAEKVSEAARQAWEGTRLPQGVLLPGEGQDPALARCLPPRWWERSESHILAEKIFADLQARLELRRLPI